VAGAVQPRQRATDGLYLPFPSRRFSAALGGGPLHGAIKTLESPVLSRRNILPVGLHEKARREAGLMVLWQRSVVAPLLRHFLGLSPQQIILKLARAR
jgi:hypothetical protein